MNRVLLSLLLLEVCFGNAVEQRAPLSTDVQRARRVVRDLDIHQTTFGKKGDYITTVIFVDLPTFSNITDVGDVNVDADKFKIHYSNVKFYKLSSAYAYSYKIDLDAKEVQLLLLLGKAQIKGLYSIPNTEPEEFELNLYADLIYTHNIFFEINNNGEITFGNTRNPRLLHKKVKGKYAKPPSAHAADLDNYLNPKLLDAVVAKIYDEVHHKVKLVELGYQIKNEVAFRYRNHIAALFEKAIFAAFEDIHENLYNVFYHDSQNFNKIIQNFDVKIPNFVLRDIEGFKVDEAKMAFVGEDVQAKVKFVVPSPLALFRIVYRNINDPQAQNKTVKGEYYLSNVIYEIELTAKHETKTVEVNGADITISDVKIAPTQGRYYDERDTIIRELIPPYIKNYFEGIVKTPFLKYTKGLVDEGRIAYNVFK